MSSINSQINILVNFFEANKIAFGNHFLRNSTDFLYPKNFKLLEDNEMKINFNSCAWSFLHYLSLIFIERLTDRHNLSIRYFTFLKEQLRTVYLPDHLLKNIDLFFSHGLFPVGLRKKGIPVLSNSGFMTNKFEGAISDEERLNEVRQICKMSKESTLITFSSKNAIERFCTFAPGMRAKIKMAPFLIPKIPKLGAEDMYKKHFAKKIKLCFVGTDGKRKGLFNLVTAINNIYRNNPRFFENCEWYFVTRDPVVLPAGVNFTHYKSLSNSSVLKIMRESAVFCMPTLKDAYGIVYLEAMGNGCAVLCDNEMPRIEIFNQKWAEFTNPDSITQIERGLIKLISDDTYRFEMASQSYAHYNKHYAFEVVSNYYSELFKETMSIEAASFNVKK